MPIRNDGTGKRWLEMEFLVPGTPEQVWQALATGEGNTAWFTNAAIDERVGGALRFDFGPSGSSVGEVTRWDPPGAFGYVEPNWSPGAPAVATEITITARSGDRCLVRMVHSLFTSSDAWDDQMEGFERGWPSFFDVLRVYLTHFAGMPAASFVASATVDGDSLAVWKRLTSQLAVAGADAGDRRTTPPRPEALSGVIERVHQQGSDRYLLLRLDSPAPGIALVAASDAGAQVIVNVLLYFYGGDAAARAAAGARTWQAWLDEQFAPAARAPESLIAHP
jgi:uncharacterized protein YndB with AHSA1/START domain